MAPGRKTKLRGMVRRDALRALLVLVCAGGGLAHGAPVTPPPPAPTFPGILLPGQTALVKAKFNSVVAEAGVNSGTVVHRGDLLISLVADQERVARDRAAALLDQARADFDRVRSLHAESLSANRSLEEAETAVKTAQADLDLAGIMFEEHFIRAPFDGVVAQRFVDRGASLLEGDPIIRVTALTPLRMEVILPERMLSAISRGAVLEVVPASPETTLVLSLPPRRTVVDPASGSFSLQAEIANTEGRLVPGVSCRVTVRTSHPGSP
jgi:membrane fusion protein, multidrug efflux system